MLYCTKCQILTEGECPVCSRRKGKLRAPQAGDPVFLLNCRVNHAAMVEPVLSENNIPYSRTGALGAALSTAFGSAFELYRFYVPFAAYTDAYRLIHDIFGEDDELMKRVAEYGVNDNNEISIHERQNP